MAAAATTVAACAAAMLPDVHRQYIFHHLPVGSGYEHVLDELSAGPVIAGLDARRHRLNGGVSVRRKNKRRVDHHNGCNAVGMSSGQLQDDHASHAVADRDCLTKALLYNDISNIVSIGRDRVWPRWFITLAMPAQIYRNHAMARGEMLGLWSEERAIAVHP